MPDPLMQCSMTSGGQFMKELPERILCLIVLNQVTDASVDTIRVRAEARVLRGIYHFEALKLWGSVPYINEYVDPNVGKK